MHNLQFTKKKKFFLPRTENILIYYFSNFRVCPSIIRFKKKFQIISNNCIEKRKSSEYLVKLKEENRIYITKLRSSYIKIPLETGRWHNIPKEERLCTTMCKK